MILNSPYTLTIKKEERRYKQTPIHLYCTPPQTPKKKKGGVSVHPPSYLRITQCELLPQSLHTNVRTQRTKDPPHAGHIFNTDKRRILKGGGWLRILQNARGEGVRKRDKEGREDFALFSPIQAQQDENMNPELCCSLQMDESLSRLNAVSRALSWLAEGFVPRQKREKKKRR